jgi:hypothetical protein
MELTIIHYECDEFDNETETELSIEAEYHPAEPDSSWGYYGASPGCDASVDILSISELVRVHGPHINPYANEYRRVIIEGGEASDWFRKFIDYAYNIFSASGPVVYMIPWEGELFDNDMKNIKSLCEKAYKEAKDEGAISAYEDRRASMYYD